MKTVHGHELRTFQEYVAFVFTNLLSLCGGGHLPSQMIFFAKAETELASADKHCTDEMRSHHMHGTTIQERLFSVRGDCVLSFYIPYRFVDFACNGKNEQLISSLADDAAHQLCSKTTDCIIIICVSCTAIHPGWRQSLNGRDRRRRVFARCA